MRTPHQEHTQFREQHSKYNLYTHCVAHENKKFTETTARTTRSTDAQTGIMPIYTTEKARDLRRIARTYVRRDRLTHI